MCAGTVVREKEKKALNRRMLFRGYLNNLVCLEELLNGEMVLLRTVTQVVNLFSFSCRSPHRRRPLPSLLSLDESGRTAILSLAGPFEVQNTAKNA